MRRILGLLALVLLSSGGGFSRELNDVLSSIVAAYGGPEALARLDSYRMEGRVDRVQGGQGRLIRDFQAPDKLKVGIIYPDRSELRLVVGDEAWRGSGDGVAKVQGPLRTAMIYQLLRSHVPGVLLLNRDRLEDRGVVEHENGRHRLLALQWPGGIEMRYWVDDGASRVTHVESTLTMGSHRTVFATEFDDFRLIDGALFPFREKNYASGRHVADTTVEAVSLEPEDLGPFAPPQDSGRKPNRR